MPGYLVRIELHGVNALASFETYQKLHDTLKSAQVCRSVVGDDGRISMLPTGTYYVEGPATDPADVRQNIVNLVAPLGHRYEVVVARTESWAAQNLEQVAARI